ncbi:MAG: hypothetical protein KAI43_00930 [Candidatus Aureabacteria bacterium]|nr:hypothetical protein [Candidatus Auribacterota bacterium]
MIRSDFLRLVFLFSVLFLVFINVGEAVAKDYYFSIENMVTTEKEVIVEGTTDLPDATVLHGILYKGGVINETALRNVNKGIFRFYFTKGLVPANYSVNIIFSLEQQLDQSVLDGFGGIKASTLGKIKGMERQKREQYYTAIYDKQFEIGGKDEIEASRKKYNNYIINVLSKLTDVYMDVKKLHALEINKKDIYKIPFDEEKWSKEVSKTQILITETEEILKKMNPYVIDAKQKEAYAYLVDAYYFWIQSLHKIYFMHIKGRPLEDAMQMWPKSMKLNLDFVEGQIKKSKNDIYRILGFGDSDNSRIEYIYKKGMKDIETIINDKLKEFSE